MARTKSAPKKKAIVSSKNTGFLARFKKMSGASKVLVVALLVSVIATVGSFGYVEWQKAQKTGELAAKADSAQKDYDLLGKTDGVAAWICRNVKIGDYSENEVIFVNDNWKSNTPATQIQTSSKDRATGVSIGTNAVQREWYNYVSAMPVYTSSDDTPIRVLVNSDPMNPANQAKEIGKITQKDVNTCPSKTGK